MEINIFNTVNFVHGSLCEPFFPNLNKWVCFLTSSSRKPNKMMAYLLILLLLKFDSWLTINYQVPWCGRVRIMDYKGALFSSQRPCQHLQHHLILTSGISSHWQQPGLQAQGDVLTYHTETLKEVAAFCRACHMQVVQHSFNVVCKRCCWRSNRMALGESSSTGYCLVQLQNDTLRLPAEHGTQLWGFLIYDQVHIFITRIKPLIHGRTPSAGT